MTGEGAWLEVPSGTPLAPSQRRPRRARLARPSVAAGDVRARNRRRDADPAPASISSTAGTTPLTLLEKLVAGEVYLHQSRSSKARASPSARRAARASGDRRTELDGAAIMAALGAPGVHPEGQFFPDTYRFPKGTPDIEILRVAHEALAASARHAAWQNRSPDTHAARRTTKL